MLRICFEIFFSFAFQAWEKDMVDKEAVGVMYEDAEVFQSSILESRQAEHAAEVIAAEERARAHRKQKKVAQIAKDALAA